MAGYSQETLGLGWERAIQSVLQEGVWLISNPVQWATAKPSAKVAFMARYECTVCGYVYDDEQG